MENECNYRCGGFLFAGGASRKMAPKVAALLLLLFKAISLYKMTTQLLLCTGKNYCRKKKLYNELIGLISGSQAQLMRVKRIKKKRKPRKYWVRPGRTSLWWDNM